MMDIHIIDDDAFVGDLHSNIAKSVGFSAKTFSCPDTYLKYMTSSEYSPPLLAILTDMEMPEMSGYELMEKVRGINPDQRFVVITGAPSIVPGIERACFYLEKPTSVRKLRMVFEALSKCIEVGFRPECMGTIFDDRSKFCVNGSRCPHYKEH